MTLSRSVQQFESAWGRHLHWELKNGLPLFYPEKVYLSPGKKRAARNWTALDLLSQLR